MEAHPSQLLLCHELIAAEVTIHGGRQERRRQWCNLLAHAWCFDDEFYICQTHLAANHQRHHVQLVADEKGREEPPDRRSGEERRKD